MSLAVADPLCVEGVRRTSVVMSHARSPWYHASFPTGAFNHSYGFETWIDSELINDGSSFEVACRDWLTYSLASADGAAVAHAHRAMQAGDIDALVSLDELVGALKLSREAREASDKTGHALLSALRDVFEPQKLKAFESAIKTGRCAGHQAVIFGAAAGGCCRCATNAGVARAWWRAWLARDWRGWRA